MEAIIKNLSDPSWWFSAFIVAIFASIIAGFLKDRIERMLSKFSDSFRRWRATKLELRTKTLEALVENPVYLSFVLHHLNFGIVLWVLATLLFLATPILHSMETSSDTALIFLDQNDLPRIVFMLLMGVLSVVIAYRVAIRASIVFEAIRLYRKKHGLPKLP
jgi:hypothetical protein